MSKRNLIVNNRHNSPRYQAGITLVEVIVSTAIAAMLLAGLSGIAGQAAQVFDDINDRNKLNRQARFAMQQMVNATSWTNRVLLPLANNPGTNWPEHVREETVPPSPPIGDSTLATAVLAVLVSEDQDLDGNSIADADNDQDGMINENLPNDVTNDGVPGIFGIDDNGDGTVDDSSIGSWDDDEDDSINEDSVFNNNDADGDGSIDEDPYADMNYDGMPGIAGVDDDGDGTVDEGGVFASWNDDEDDSTDEDWYDALVFYMNNGNLYQRTPVPWDEDGDLDIDGSDTVESIIAENVSRFRVERLPPKGNRPLLLDITLELTSPTTGQVVSLHSRIRAGSAR